MSEIVVAAVLVAAEVGFMLWLVGRPRSRGAQSLSAGAYRLGLRARFR